MKAIQLLVNSKLPPEYRDYSATLNGQFINDTLAQIALKDPSAYSDISSAIADIGREASFMQGDTITLQDLKPVIDKQALFDLQDLELTELSKRNLPKPEHDKERLKIWQKYSDRIGDETLTAALAKGNNLGYSVASGARGNATQLKAMISTPGLYADSKGNTVPFFIRNSFSEGLRPAEILASTHGARTSVISTKESTAKAGDLLKQLQVLAARTIVTEKDCGTDNGVDYTTEDSDALLGRVLPRAAAGVPAGTIIDRRVLAHLRRNKLTDVVARSPLTCTARDGICAHCAGLGTDRQMPKIGEAVGITAAQAIGEPIVQGGLNSKHTGGAATGKKSFSGFDYIKQFVQAPEHFPDRAAVAELDGVVESVREAPQGGTYIKVGGKEHYVQRGFDVNVKVGNTVEAGDILSDGIANPREIVAHRGIGEGRRYYAQRFKQLLNDSKYGGNTRNVELIARAAVDHVRLSDPDELDGFESYLPDDVISYNKVVGLYNPPHDAKRVNAKQAIGQYLQAPALHYSIGTRITPKVADKLTSVGYTDVFSSASKPAFNYELPNLRTATHHEEDWIAQQSTSYLGKQLLSSATRGRDSNVIENHHFVPRLSFGVDFGKNVEETGKF